MEIPVSNARWSVAQLLIALFLVLVACVYATRINSTLSFSDESDYYHIAHNLWHMHSFSVDGVVPTASRPPGYPLLLAALESVNEGVRFGKICNLSLWFICALLTASIARKLFGQLAATCSLIFGFLYVVELYSAGTLYPQALASTLFLVVLWLHFVWRHSGGVSEALLQALVWATLILTVPVFLVNLVVWLVWLGWSKRTFKRPALIFGLVIIAIVPWAARNKSIYNSYFLSDNTGLMLIHGNSDLTGPNTGPTLPLKQMAPQQVWDDKDEFRRDNGYKHIAIEWIKTHRQRAAILYVEKTLNWFNCQTGLKTVEKDSGIYQYLIAAVYYPLLFGAALSPFLIPGSRRIEALFAAQYVLAGCAYAIFFTRIRYRLSYDYLLVLLAAGSAAAILERRKGKDFAS